MVCSGRISLGESARCTLSSVRAAGFALLSVMADSIVPIKSPGMQSISVNKGNRHGLRRQVRPA
jgi:hypothetical protein